MGKDFNARKKKTGRYSKFLVASFICGMRCNKLDNAICVSILASELTLHPGEVEQLGICKFTRVMICRANSKLHSAPLPQHVSIQFDVFPRESRHPKDRAYES